MGSPPAKLIFSNPASAIIQTTSMAPPSGRRFPDRLAAKQWPHLILHPRRRWKLTAGTGRFARVLASSIGQRPRHLPHRAETPAVCRVRNRAAGGARPAEGRRRRCGPRHGRRIPRPRPVRRDRHGGPDGRPVSARRRQYPGHGWAAPTEAGPGRRSSPVPRTGGVFMQCHYT